MKPEEITLRVDGMTCQNCQARIEKRLGKIAGVVEAEVRYDSGTARVRFDPERTSKEEIVGAIVDMGYRVGRGGNGARIAGAVVLVLAVYMIMQHFGLAGLFSAFPLAEAGMGYGMLFVIGLMTSVHCIAMCGGINLTQTLPSGSGPDPVSRLRPTVLYNLGRVISYTVIGAVVGALGAVISFSDTAKGVVQLAAGGFMVIMGLNMMGMFPWLRRITPRLPASLAKLVHGGEKGNGPLVVGLLNGLMPCGPLQAMQLYALSTGSAFRGALSMLLFSLGTVPLMFGLGVLGSLLGKRVTGKAMQVGAVLVVVLGISMLRGGMSLADVGGVGSVSATAASASVLGGEGVQTVRTTLAGGRFEPITVEAGTPVRWIIDAPQGSINGCNYVMAVPEYGIQLQLETGENVIEFMPETPGVYQYRCWMGMIRSTITVVDGQGGTGGAEPVLPEEEGLPTGQRISTGGSCCSPEVAAAFADGGIPTDEILLAEEVDGVQRAEIKVGAYGYSPAVVVIERGKEFVLDFAPDQLNTCNSFVYFPAFGGGVDLTANTGTPVLTAEEDFSFECWMGMLHGYVKVVDDLADVDLEEVRAAVAGFAPAASGGGCCG